MKRLLLAVCLLAGTTGAFAGNNDPILKSGKITSNFIAQNNAAMSDFISSPTKVNLQKLSTRLEIEGLLKANGYNVKFSPNCPDGQMPWRMSNEKIDDKGSFPIVPSSNFSNERRKEIFQIGVSDGECAYIVHVYYNTGFLGLFPSEEYQCAELIGCI